MLQRTLISNYTNYSFKNKMSCIINIGYKSKNCIFFFFLKIYLYVISGLVNNTITCKLLTVEKLLNFTCVLILNSEF